VSNRAILEFVRPRWWGKLHCGLPPQVLAFDTWEMLLGAVHGQKKGLLDLLHVCCLANKFNSLREIPAFYCAAFFPPTGGAEGLTWVPALKLGGSLELEQC
jgi:hypothetical protein